MSSPLHEYVTIIRATSVCNLEQVEGSCLVFGFVIGSLCGIATVTFQMRCRQTSEKQYSHAYSNSLMQHWKRSDLFYQLFSLLIVTESDPDDTATTNHCHSVRGDIEQQLRRVLSNPPDDLCLRSDTCSNDCFNKTRFLEDYADVVFRDCLLAASASVLLDLSDPLSFEWQDIQPLLNACNIVISQADMQSYFTGSSAGDEWWIPDLLAKLYERGISVIEIRKDQFILFHARDFARIESLLQQLYSVATIKWVIIANPLVGRDRRMRLYSLGESYRMPGKTLGEELQQYRTFGPTFPPTATEKLISYLTPKSFLERLLLKWVAYFLLAFVAATVILGGRVVVCAYPFVTLLPYGFAVACILVLCIAFCIDACCKHHLVSGKCRGRPESIRLDGEAAEYSLRIL